MVHQYFCLENPMDRGAWQAIVHGGHKSVRHDWTITLSHFFTFHHDWYAWFYFCHIGVLFNVHFYLLSLIFWLIDIFAFHLLIWSPITEFSPFCFWNQIPPFLLYCVSQIPNNSSNMIYCVPSKMLYLLPILFSHRICRKLPPLPLLPPYPFDKDLHH